jgi:hypothetical protein
MGESGVEHALSEGRRETDIRRDVEHGLRELFSCGSQTIVFDTQMAYVRQTRGPIRPAASSGAIRV